ncbi:hypothetical protein FQY83_03890 [Luteimonas marina]|uniref:Uncharacterized protein n=1 Tax=Luteimonas marina TaxID=488485 RepID=A0A5C5UCT2_9GAMM|nr:hypothetical protein [Luteimonas marina]TWT23766.1 hypothetical protein FQY83_03890 [Luteimonas marina]
MNRKLRNTILAFSVSGVMLAVGLMAARPVLPDAAPATGTMADVPTPTRDQPLPPLATHADADALSMRIDARSRRFEAELAKAESLEHALATTASFVTVVATEAALAEVVSLGAVEEAERASEEASTRRKRRAGSVRSAIAVPYFSFARGTGRGDRS